MRLATSIHFLTKPRLTPIYRSSGPLRSLKLQRPLHQPIKFQTTMSSKPQTTKTSTCNCKQVEISVTGVDKGSVLCHCSNCRRASGSAFAYNIRFVPCELKFVKGQDTIRTYEDNDTKSGNVLSRHFCGNCVSLTFAARAPCL